MRQTVFLFAAAAAALVTPRSSERQPSLDSEARGPSAVQTWWDSLPDAESLLSGIGDRISSSARRGDIDSLLALLDDEADGEDHPPHGGHGHHGHCGDPDKTIYEQIKKCKHTSKFAKLVEEHDDIKKLLDDTKHNHTLFVPTNRAFERIPHHGDDDDDDDDDEHDHKPSKEFILALLKYHITPGLYPLRRVRYSHTLPSSLHPHALSADVSSEDHHHHDDDHDDDSSHPQRIRVFTTPLLRTTNLNFHARVRGGDCVAKNGLVHAIDALLVPPPSQTTIVRLLPNPFSTLALALETTGLGAELDGLPRRGGGTLFAPTNHAWARLGPRANAFLFSKYGKKYLKALLKYHVVVNETVYSDAYYRGHGHGGGDDKEHADGLGGGGGYWHVDVPSLLHGKPLSVDIKTWKGFVSIVVNGFTRVVVRDGVANDGVVQVVGSVLIPPHKHHGGHGAEEAEDLGVEELKDRLEPYLEEPEADGPGGMGDL